MVNFKTTVMRLPPGDIQRRYLDRSLASDGDWFENRWLFKYENVPVSHGMNTNELKFAVRVYSNIGHTVRTRYHDCPGPLTLMLGMSNIIGVRTKLHYVMNQLGIVRNKR